MVACSDTAFDEESQNLVPMTIEALSESTRTVLDGTSVLWSEGDEAAVYDFKTTKHRFASQTTDGRTKFVGKVTAKSEPFAAIYPYDLAADAASSASALAATLPAEQYAVLDGFPVGMNISVAKGARNIDGSPSSVTFYNVCQLLRFSVPAYAANKVTRITFTAQTPVAGKLNIDYSGTSPVVSIASTEGKVITVLPPSGTNTFAAGTYYILTAPVQLNGFSMTMQTADNKTYRLASDTQFGGVAGHIYSLGNIDLVNTPSVTECHHVYDANNLLVGTTLTVAGAPIEGKPWTVNIKNSAGTIVRTLSVSGDSQTSDETDASWPYLPAGTYTLDCKYTTSNNREIAKALPNLTIPAPTLTLTVDCYTAHTLYEQNNIAGANTCDRLTVYSPSAKLNVSDALLENANYTLKFTRSFNNQTATTSATTNTSTWGNYTNIPVSSSLYTFSVTANFAGSTLSASKQVRITGLPYSIDFSNHSEWKTDGGKITWNKNSVRFGYESIQGRQSAIINNSSVNIPANTSFCADYSLIIQTATAGTTFTLSAGNQTLISITEDGKFGDLTGTTHSYPNKTSKVVRDVSNSITSVKCHNSYGLSLTYSELLGLTLKYSK